MFGCLWLRWGGRRTLGGVTMVLSHGSDRGLGCLVEDPSKLRAGCSEVGVAVRPPGRLLSKRPGEMARDVLVGREAGSR